MIHVEDLASRAAAGDRSAVGRLISAVEDRRPSTCAQREQLMETLKATTRLRAGVIGLTGSPGSGKSSLLGAVVKDMLQKDPDLTLAVVAVDPSSPTSGGAFLGDRTRIRPDDTDRLFVRSQATSTSLGGLAPRTQAVVAVLARLFDLVLVETVGIGQSELDVRHLARDMYLVVGPMAGDELQCLKAGIMEVPDAFVVSKWDEPAAHRVYRKLRTSLSLARPLDEGSLPIHCTSAKTGQGVTELADDLLRRAGDQDGPAHALASVRYFFRRWVAEEWGRCGLRHLEALGGDERFVTCDLGLSAAQTQFEDALPADLQRTSHEDISA